jgi:hypothetical protein
MEKVKRFKINWKQDLERRLGTTLNKISSKELKQIIKEVYQLQKGECSPMGIGWRVDLQLLGNELIHRGLSERNINKLFKK